MREIIITAAAMIIIVLLSLIISRIKSTRVAVVFGVFLIVVAGFGGYFARTWEFRQQVLEWVTPRGDDYVTTWRDKESLFYIGFALIVCMMLLAALCVYIDGKAGSIRSIVYAPAMMSFVLVFVGTSYRGSVNAFKNVSENVVSEEVLYNVGDELNFEISGVTTDEPTQWTSITSPLSIDSLEKNIYWRVTKNEVTSRIYNIYNTEYNYVGVEDDEMGLFKNWVRVSDSKLRVTTLIRKKTEIVSMSEHYPDITTSGKRYYMVVDLEPVDKDWKSKFDDWKKTVDELQKIAHPNDKEKN